MVMMMKRLKTYLPTIVISSIIPLYFFLLEKISPHKEYGIVIAVVSCISIWIVYYQIVAKCKENAVDKKIRMKRIIISFSIQFVLCVLMFFVPLMYELQQPLERGHHTPIEMLFIPTIILLEPVLNHLWCSFLDLIVIKMPSSIFRKIRNR